MFLSLFMGIFIMRFFLMRFSFTGGGLGRENHYLCTSIQKSNRNEKES